LALRRRRVRPLDAGDARPPVVLLHGYAQHPANFTWLARRLRRDGWRHLYLVAHTPVGGDIERSAHRLGEALDRLRRATGASRVDIVAHSMGGLVARACIRARGQASGVGRLLTPGTPAADRAPRARRPGRRTVAALTLTVGAGAARLDAFLHGALPALSRRFVRRLIAEGAVCVNGRPAAKGVRVAPGDRVTLPDLPATITPEPGLALAVLHEDDALVALDKPGGMPGHALDPRQRGPAAAFLLARYPEMADVGDPLAPGLVHRLDSGTSGLLVAARTRAAHCALRAALRARAVEKRYLAWVPGDASALDGARVALPLAH